MLRPVRARDLRSAIKELGFEQGVVAILERLLDEHAQSKQNMRDLTLLVDKCINEASKMVQVGGALRNELQELRRLQQQEDGINGLPHE